MATPEVHQLLINTLTHEHNCVLQYDSERQALVSWLWPVEPSGALVSPEKLREHRTSHEFLGPSCFCPALEGDNSTGFVEAAMFDRGDGQFVAMCPTDNCNYLGDGTMQPPPAYHQSEDRHNIFKRAHFETCELDEGMWIAMPAMRPMRGAIPRPKGYSELLDKLDSRVRPGIPEEAMRHLFVKCKKCSQVTTRRAFLFHGC